MQRPRQSSAYTLVEVLISSLLSLIVVAGIFAVINTTNILTTKITGINATNIAIQNALDRVQLYLQQSYSTAYPLQISGTKILVVSATAPLSGTIAYSRGMVPVVAGTGATVTGTGIGVKFYRYVNGPYLATIPATGLLATSSSITLKAYTGSDGICSSSSVPQPGDVLLIYTTAQMGNFSGSATQTYECWANVAGVNSTSSLGGGTTQYVIALTGTMRTAEVEGTNGAYFTGTAISYMYDYSRGAAIMWSTYLLRPTAVFLSYRNSSTELGVLEPCSTTGTVVNTSTNYSTLARLCSGSSPLLTSGVPSPFAVVSLSNSKFVSVTLQATTDSTAYLTGKQDANGFSTFMGIRSMIHLKSRPSKRDQ